MSPKAKPVSPAWLFEIMGLIFPLHFRALWLQDRPVQVEPSGLLFPFDHLAEVLTRNCPFSPDQFVPAPRVAQSAVSLPGHPVMTARYLALPRSESMREPMILALMVNPLAQRAQSGMDAMAHLKLTRREATIALELAGGANLKTISEMSNRSLSTTRNLLKSAMRKTGCHTQAEFIGLIWVSI